MDTEFVERPEGCPEDATHIDQWGWIWKGGGSLMRNLVADIGWHAPSRVSVDAVVLRPLAPAKPAEPPKDADGWRPMSEVPARAGRILLQALGAAGLSHLMWDGAKRTSYTHDHASLDHLAYDKRWSFGMDEVHWRYADEPAAAPTPEPRDELKYGSPTGLMESDRPAVVAASEAQAVREFFSPPAVAQPTKPTSMPALLVTASHAPRFPWGV